MFAARDDFVSFNVTFYSNDDTKPFVTWYIINNDTSKEIVNGTGNYMYQTSNTSLDVVFYSKQVRQPGYITNLIITGVQAKDFATFLMRVNNSIGYNETQVKVSPRGKVSS